MIPNQDFGQTISSGNMVTGEATIEMSPAMFDILSNKIYTDKVLAVIRESLCNGRDAQVEVGETRPMEVHLPGRLEPFFHIRDYGTGLSERQVVGYTERYKGYDELTGEPKEMSRFIPGLYMRYGKSTKEASNDFIGGFGIGCKSPLAYSDSFIVESYQEGVCKTYTIYKEDGKPRVAKLTETMTTEPNGLKVKLAVKVGDENEFINKTAKFLKHFGYPVDVRGTRGQHTFEVPKPILDTALYSTYSCHFSIGGEVAVIMGGVVYKLTSQYKQRISQIVKKDFMLMKFGIGELTVAASREGLSEDPQTVAAIEARIEEVSATFYKDVVTQVDAAATEHEAFKLLDKYNLIKQDYRAGGSYIPTKAAEQLTIRKGKLIETFLTEFTTGSYRVIWGQGTRKNDSRMAITGLDSDVVLLDLDKKTGYLKVARRLADDGSVVVLLELDKEKVTLEAFFGSLTTKKVSVEYPVMFPKGERGTSIKVASSGLRTYDNVPVTTLEEDQEGYYIPYMRNTCEMKGIATLGLTCSDETGVARLVANLVEGGVFTDDEVFFSRKAGMPAIKKTELKELTADIIIDKVKALVTQDDMDIIVQKHGEISDRIFGHKLNRLWHEVKSNYPLHGKIGLGDLKTKVRGMLRDLPITMLNSVIPDYTVLVDKIQATYYVERRLIKKENKLALTFSSWDINEDLVEELIVFSRFKKSERIKSEKGV